MPDDGLPDTADKQIETAPRPPEEKPGADGEHPAEGEVAPQSQEAAAPEGLQDSIRSVFVARTIASSEESGAGLSHVKDSDDGVALRGAYLAHLADADTAPAGGGDLSSGNVLREAYMARAAVGLEARERRRPKRPAKARRKAAAPSQRRKSSEKPAKSLDKHKAKATPKKPAKSLAKRPAKKKAKAADPAPARRHAKAKTGAAAAKKATRPMVRGKAKAPGAQRAKHRG